MPEIYHVFGQDLQVTASGSLATVSGSQEGQQRVLRRLLTNPGAYIWNLRYGAGLPSYIGQPNPGWRIEAVARQQMQLEKAVSQFPQLPSVSVNAGTNGETALTIGYVDAPSDANVTLTVPLG